MKIKKYIFVLIPCVVFVFHSLLFRTWLVDDAGISFSYARNLASGYGLVSQPGNVPVEGFSNFLWVLLITLFFLLKLFFIPGTLKILSMALVIGSFFIIQRTISYFSANNKSMVTFFSLLFLSVNPSFVIWVNSGLENPLYVFLLSLLLFQTVCVSSGENYAVRKGMYSGIIAAFVAMTRPDGIIFCVAYPTIIFLSVTVTGKPATDKPRSANLMAYLLGFAVLFGCFMAFRILYFNDIVPNSSYAVFKRADYVQNLFNLLTLRTGKMAFNLLVSMTGGTYYYLIKLFLFVATVFLIARRRFKIEHFVSGIFMLCAFSEYLLLPEEGIPEFRLATSFFLFFTIYLIVLFDLAVNNMFRSPRMRYIITAGVLLIFVAMRLPEFYVRSAWFAKNPFVPFSACARMFGNGFNILADSVGLRNGSVLLADVGGPLYCSKLRVYDLGGLCDKTIAKTLLKDQEKFYDYVFEEIKPVFIEVHNCWAYFANFHYDKRFERDYVPIREGENNNGLVVNFGYYVRRDAISQSAEKLNRIREADKKGPKIYLYNYN